MITASHPTVPESPETIKIQIQQLKDGIRNVVMFPKGTEVPGKARDIGMRDITTGGQRFWHNPAKIKAGDIAAAVKKNELPKILGNDGYGAPDKSKLEGPTVAVVSETKQAVPIQDILADKPTLPKAVKAAERLTPPGGAVKVKPPAEVIAKRVDPNRARVNAMREITKLATSGDIHGALRAAGAHTAAGTLNDSHVDKALDIAGPAALKAGFAAIPELHHAIKVFQGARSEHQDILRPILTARIHSMERRPPAEQRAVLAKLNEHGLLPNRG